MRNVRLERDFKERTRARGPHVLVVMLLLDEERDAAVYLAFNQESHRHGVFALIWDPRGPGKTPGIGSTTVNKGEAPQNNR